jgi:uracil-DNA glycosylase family 4
MKQDTLYCASCPYFKRGFVPGRGSDSAKIMFIGEAPGMDESFRSHRPFSGPAGMELDRFLKDIHINREDIWITNLVKCNPPGNEDPTPEVIERCSHYMEQEIVKTQPDTIVSLGSVSLRYFREDLNLEMVWGIPQEIEHPWAGKLFPLYHPALGLHMTRMLPRIAQGFNRLRSWLSGGEVWKQDTVTPDYHRVDEWLGPDWQCAYAIGVDTETTWDGKPLSIQLSKVQGQASLVQEGFEVAKSIMEEGEAITILHNSMFDLEVLHQLDIHPARVVDTMVMAYILGDLPQGLKALAYRLCGMTMKSYPEVMGSHGQLKAKEYLEMASMLSWPDPDQELEVKEGKAHIKKPQNIGKKITRALNDSGKGEVNLRERWTKMDGTEVVESALGPMPGADLRDVPEEEAITYACRDADATRRIYPILKHRIKDEGLEGILEMDMGIIPMVLEMQRNGITVDLKALEKAGTRFQAGMAEQERVIQKLIGYHLNPGSSPQVAAMLEKEGIEGKKKKGKSGAQSTGVKVLEPLRKDYPVVAAILEWRKFETLLSMFVNPMPSMVAADGKVHTTIKTTRTITGRLAMENPNLQNIPTRTEEGRMLREAFVASPGYVLVGNDYSQIELRVLAHMAKDEAMIRAFLEGYDLHTATAAEMFGIPMDQVDEYRHRKPAKTVNFGIPYGITAMGLVDTMYAGGATGWTESSCQDLIDRWFKARPGVKNFMEEYKAYARRHGYITDMFGRKRLTPEIFSTSKRIVEEGLRYAMNQPIQSGAQGVIKLAMGRVWREFLTQIEPGIIRPLLQVHDDLLFEIREEDIGWTIPIIQDLMERTVKLVIQTPVDQKVGERWGSMKKW